MGVVIEICIKYPGGLPRINLTDVRSIAHGHPVPVLVPVYNFPGESNRENTTM